MSEEYPKVNKSKEKYTKRIQRQNKVVSTKYAVKKSHETSSNPGTQRNNGLNYFSSLWDLS